MYVIQACRVIYVYKSKSSKIKLCVHILVDEIQVYNHIAPLTLHVGISIFLFSRTQCQLKR